MQNEVQSRWFFDRGSAQYYIRHKTFCPESQSWKISTKYKYLLNICEFIYFVWAYLLQNAVAYDCVILHADAYRPCAKHLLDFYTFMSKGVIVTNNDIFHKNTWMYCRPTASQRWRVGRLTGWLQPRQAVAKGCVINSVTINSTSKVRSR